MNYYGQCPAEGGRTRIIPVFVNSLSRFWSRPCNSLLSYYQTGLALIRVSDEWERTNSSSKDSRPVSLTYQSPTNSTFLLKQTSHQQPASSTLLSQQISTSHRPPTKQRGLHDLNPCTEHLDLSTSLAIGDQSTV
jgi:hypothetical protein